MKILTDETLEEISNWAQAYPLDIFPEPDLKLAHAALQARGMTIDSVSASAGRHFAKYLQTVIDAAPEVPEGCTPADARVLRYGNQILAVESERRAALLREAHAMLDEVGASPEGADRQMAKAEELQRRILLEIDRAEHDARIHEWEEKHRD